MNTSPPAASPLALALTELLAAYRDEADVPGVLKAIERDPALKRALAPVAAPIRWGDAASGLVHRCLEQPPGSPLREAASTLLAQGIYAEPVHVRLAPTPSPARYTMQLLPSRVAPVLYGTTPEGRVAIWSSEDGSHLGDLAIPQRGSRSRGLVELPDGRLRVLTSQGDIAERAPGEEAFTRVLNVKAKGCKHFSNHVSSADLRHHLVATDDYIVSDAQGAHLEFLLHDLSAPRKPRTITIPNSHWLGTMKKLGPTTAGVVHAHPGAEDEVYALTLVDLTSGALLQELPVRGNILRICPSADGQAVLVNSAEGDQAARWWRIERADGQRTEIAPEAIDPEEQKPREVSPPGLSYDVNRHAIVDPRGTILARYSPVGLLTATSVYAGPRPGTFVITSGGDDGTLTLIAPYDPARTATPLAPPEPLDPKDDQAQERSRTSGAARSSPPSRKGRPAQGSNRTR